MKLATALIDRSALRHNLQRVREISPKSKLLAVVKANAYGHGLLKITHAIKDNVDCFGVARIDEAVALRKSGIELPILLLNGFLNADDLLQLVENNIETVVHCTEQLEVLENTHLVQLVKVWMKLDTGMHRLGVRTEEADAFYQRLCECANIRQPVNIISHFCRADEPEETTTCQQIQCFNTFSADKTGEKSIAASAGILLWPEAHFDWVRPGIMLYGASPQMNKEARDFGLLSVMTLKSRLIAVRSQKLGETVGYGSTWESNRDTNIGVVAMGYGDGYPRSAPSGTPVKVNGRKVPIIGRVSMDLISVDLGPEATDKVGDEVIFWGNTLPVEEIAKYTGLSAYELITRLTSRVTMEYLEENIVKERKYIAEI